MTNERTEAADNAVAYLARETENSERQEFSNKLTALAMCVETLAAQVSAVFMVLDKYHGAELATAVTAQMKRTMENAARSE